MDTLSAETASQRHISLCSTVVLVLSEMLGTGGSGFTRRPATELKVRAMIFLLTFRTRFCLSKVTVIFMLCFFPSETILELEKVSRDFCLLPQDFMGTLVDKFFGGSLGGRGWPTGTIKVAELCAEFSFLGIEAISRCCKYRGYLTNAWILKDMQKELCEGGILCSVNLGISSMKLVHFGVMLKCKARKAPHGISGALGCTSCMYFERCCESCKFCTV